MILQVPFDQFAATAKRVLNAEEAFVAPHLGHALVTASRCDTSVVVAALMAATIEEAKEKVAAAGFEVYDGQWGAEVQLEIGVPDLEEVYVAGVAYATEAGQPPGIWLDSYHSLPTQVQVLKTMYDEMIQTGEMTEVSFEEFVRMSNPNVVIASPQELRSYLTQKETQAEGVGEPASLEANSASVPQEGAHEDAPPTDPRQLPG